MDSDLLITLIFAAIAVFVILKLRSVLGTRMTLTYIGLVVVFSAVAGFAYGAVF